MLALPRVRMQHTVPLHAHVEWMLIDTCLLQRTLLMKNRDSENVALFLNYVFIYEKGQGVAFLLNYVFIHENGQTGWVVTGRRTPSGFRGDSKSRTRTAPRVVLRY